MYEKVAMPLNGNPRSKGKADGVSGVPGGMASGEIHGRSPGGESGGGSYPNPHTGKTPTTNTFMAHGGQTDIAYHGGGQAGEDGGSAPNAVTGSNGDSSGIESAAVPVPPRMEPERFLGGHSIKVVEESGVAAAEATGKIATDAPYEEAQQRPGSG